MDQLFSEPGNQKTPNKPRDEKYTPLAERMRPGQIDGMVGQEHLLSENAPLRKFFESGEFPSIIFWGPPGTGKTTFAMLIAQQKEYHFIRLSAIDSGVKDLRQVISNAEKLQKAGRRTLLFIDEIHRYNKSQQDGLLHAVEKGLITLIGATTENPSFEINPALLSRCHVYHLKQITDDQIKTVVEKALAEDSILNKYDIQIENWDFLINISGGDARSALNALEMAVQYKGLRKDKQTVITRQDFETALQKRTAYYDKKGETHFDTISAFIKSLRGSDPDAAIFWLAKMLNAGEDPKFIARRMVVFASEDIGNADPAALSLAVSVFQAVNLIGMPEARINLAQGVTYLASAPKSNASYVAINDAMSKMEQGIDTTIPMHIRNAPTKLMKQEGYGLDYKYPHNYENHFVEENYFPPGIKGLLFYKPTDQGKEKDLKERLEQLWKTRYK